MLLQALLILWCTISEACHFAAMCDFPQMFFQYDCLLSNPLAVVKLSSIYQAQHKGAHNAEPAIYRFFKKFKIKKNKTKKQQFLAKRYPSFQYLFLCACILALLYAHRGSDAVSQQNKSLLPNKRNHRETTEDKREKIVKENRFMAPC